jgi:hypothetical protein
MNAILSRRIRFLQLPGLRSPATIFILLTVVLFSCAVPDLRGYYTPSEAYQNAAALAGRRITVQGKVEIVADICTLAVCPPDNPCCNACSYRLGFRLDDRRSIYFSGARGGCSGNSCRANCSIIKPGKIYQVTGILKTYGGAEYYLELEEWKSIG